MRFLLTVFVLLWLQPLVVRAADPPTLADIATALEASSDAMGAFQVNIRADVKSRSAHMDEYSNTWQESVFSLGTKGRLRVEKKGNIASTASPKPVPTCRISVFDGKVARTMAGGTSYNHGKIGTPSVMQKGTDPRNFLFHFMSRPLAETLKKEPDRFEQPRQVEWQETTVVELTSKPVVREKGVAYRARHLFNPQKGLYPVYRSAEIRLPSVDDEWRVYADTSIEQWIQMDDQWLPEKAIVRSYFGLAESLRKQNAFLLSSETRVSFSNWRLKQQFGDEHFQLKFLPGIRVADGLTGKTYTVSAK